MILDDRLMQPSGTAKKTAHLLISNGLFGRNCRWRGHGWMLSFQKRYIAFSRVLPAWTAVATHGLHTAQAPPVAELSWQPGWNRMASQPPDSRPFDGFNVRGDSIPVLPVSA